MAWPTPSPEGAMGMAIAMKPRGIKIKAWPIERGTDVKGVIIFQKRQTDMTCTMMLIKRHLKKRSFLFPISHTSSRRPLIFFPKMGIGPTGSRMVFCKFLDKKRVSIKIMAPIKRRKLRWTKDFNEGEMLTISV